MGIRLRRTKGGELAVIPLRLSLHNFLCYRENVPTLDFTGLHVACLCGANGHGKSALLDAITWCLWGKARGRVQDDLISYGADEARVELEFQARGTPYRAIRRHARGGGRRRQAVTDLQLQVLEGEDSHPITGNSVRETQAKIELLLGMDYDTFINSAFLLQGRADEFTNRTPAERKEVLAKILGLTTYERLQDRAKGRLEETRAAADQTEGALAQLRHQLQDIGDPSQELAEVEQRLEALNRQLVERRQQVDALRGGVTELRRQRAELAELNRQAQSLCHDITQLESGIATVQGRIKEYRNLIQETAAIQQGVARLAEARGAFEALEQARSRFDALSQQKNSLERAISTKRVRLEAQVEHLEKVTTELVAKAEAETDLAARLDEARRELERVEAEGGEIAAWRHHHQALATRIGEAQTTAERYKVEGQDLQKKLDLLEHTQADAGEAVCPLCQTPLSADGCQHLAQTYQAEIEDKRGLYRQNQVQLRELEVEKATLERELARREQALARTRREGLEREVRLSNQVEESRQAQGQLAEAEAGLAVAMAALRSGVFAGTEQGELRQVNLQLQVLGYDEAARQVSYRQTQEMLPFEGKRHRLSQAEARLPEEEQRLAHTQDMLQRRGAELAALGERQREGEEAVAGLPQWETRLEEAERAQAELQRSQQSGIARRGYLQGQLSRLGQLGRQIAAGTAKQAALQEELGIYQELVTAFGRQGVQAMLIETVVPRLEEEANLILGRMTDNRMHVKLETQRERRTGHGEPIETLEINVSDELGLRSYEMYSGGEAFRVNLALRIALSRVLSQRLGVPLPTLFIDEGFGTQDTAGRERILDVISSIADDFDKIIVITHLDDLKDMFPVRIEVQKDGDGSTFWLS
jgi:exonuclease SbcC